MAVYDKGGAAASLAFVMALVPVGEGLTSLPLSAQSIGDRIRVTTPGLTAVGEVTVVDDQGFQMLHRGTLQSFSYRAIARLERSAGRQSQWKTGLLYGGGAGVGAGLLYGALVSGACDTLTLGGATQECAEVGAEVALLAALTWGAGGGLLGAGVGALVRRESWADIPFARTDLSFRPIVRPGLATNRMLLGVRILH